MPLSSSRADRRIPEALSSVRFSRIRQALKGWPFPFLALADITISPDVRFALTLRGDVLQGIQNPARTTCREQGSMAPS